MVTSRECGGFTTEPMKRQAGETPPRTLNYNRRAISRFILLNHTWLLSSLLMRFPIWLTLVPRPLLPTRPKTTRTITPWKRNYRDTCSSRPRRHLTVLEVYPHPTPCDDTLGKLTDSYTLRMIAADDIEMCAFRRPYRGIIPSFFKTKVCTRSVGCGSCSLRSLRKSA